LETDGGGQPRRPQGQGQSDAVGEWGKDAGASGGNLQQQQSQFLLFRVSNQARQLALAPVTILLQPSLWEQLSEKQSRHRDVGTRGVGAYLGAEVASSVECEVQEYE